MIEAVNIRKSFGNLEVLKGVDLRITQGEVVSIVGASGAGKTTLLQILGTLDSASNPGDYQLRIKDVEVGNLKDKALARFRNEHIGFIFQFHQLLPEFSALENVCIPAYIANVPKKEAEQRARELLEFLGLGNRLNHRPAELSGGEQQRVAVARALMNRPSVILADEPSGNLDSESAEKLHQLFFTLRDELNQTIVLVTHNKQLAAMADRMITIADGKILNNEPSRA